MRVHMHVYIILIKIGFQSDIGCGTNMSDFNNIEPVGMQLEILGGEERK